MPRKKKRMGDGAVVQCYLKYLHPTQELSKRFVNARDNFRLNNLVVLRREVKKIRRKDVECVVLQSDEVMNDDVHVEIYGHLKHFTVVVEGNPANFYNAATPEAIRTETDGTGDENVELPEEVLERQNFANFSEEDVSALQAVVETDNDNDPAPENIPDLIDDTGTCTYQEEWGHDGLCHRRMNTTTANLGAERICCHINPTLLDTFETFFPTNYVNEVILPEMRKHMTTKAPLTYGEFLRFLGLWLIMATIQGPSRHEFWKREQVDMFFGAPFRLTEFMSKTRFEDILASLTYTNKAAPAYRDGFHEVRGLIEAWNRNMQSVFVPSWVTCIDESMSSWSNRWTCPGFMFVPRKPHPLGNEYHTACCGESGILYAMEIVEGKSRPAEKPKDKYEAKGENTVGLLVRLSEQLRGSGKVVILDSGFCVLKGLTELRSKGIFAAALIKKRRYWPKHINGEANIRHFQGKEVGFADSITGSLNNVPFRIMGLVEPDYIMFMMTTYGTMERHGKETGRVWKEGNQQMKTSFQYPEVFANHFRYRHIVDDHNNRRHSPISIETTWATKRWENRVFAFLLAVTEINCLLAKKYFDKDEEISTLAFRKLLAKELINNKYISNEDLDTLRRSKRKSKSHENNEHEHLTIPPFKKFSGAYLVDHNMIHPQFKCTSCHKKVRRYCRCTPGIIRCVECYAIHIRDEDIVHGTPVRKSGPSSRRLFSSQS